MACQSAFLHRRPEEEEELGKHRKEEEGVRELAQRCNLKPLQDDMLFLSLTWVGLVLKWTARKPDSQTTRQPARQPTRQTV